MRSVVYGLIGSALGALVWALIVYGTRAEFGWFAWAVGGLVGLAVALGNEGSGRRAAAAGALAVLFAIASIIAGKYVAVRILAPGDEEIIAWLVEGFQDHEFIVSFLADEVAEEITAAGGEVAWLPGVDPHTAAKESEFPADVWAEAERRWIGLGAEGRAAFRDDKVRAVAEANRAELRAVVSGAAFRSMFEPVDLLFFALAMLTAFKVASGGTRFEGEPGLVSDAPVPAARVAEPVGESDLCREPGAAGYCPSCAMQYRAEIHQCPDCNAAIMPFCEPPS